MRSSHSLALFLALAAASARADYVFVNVSPLAANFSQAKGICGQEVGGVTGSAAFYGTTSSPSNNVEPPDVSSSVILGVGPGIQVGNVVIDSNAHAAMWNNTRESFHLLNDSGYTDSSANAIGNLGWAVGKGTTSSGDQALLWTNISNPNNAPTALTTGDTNLDDFSYTRSCAQGIHANRVVGYAGPSDLPNANHAILWNTSDLGHITFTDLHPAAYTDSIATGVCNDQVVGYGTVNGYSHGLLWTLSGDSVASFTDLNPAGYDSSYVSATNGTWQVGFAIDSDLVAHAFRWQGTSESALDLGIYLPADWSNAMALSIDANGFIAGSGTDTFNVTYAFVLVPEPASLLLLFPAAATLLRRRNRRSS